MAMVDADNKWWSGGCGGRSDSVSGLSASRRSQIQINSFELFFSHKMFFLLLLLLLVVRDGA
jgi:hypothetical protein